jgi:hypothetical protein
MTIPTWQERIKGDGHDFHTPAAMQAEIDELRAALASAEPAGELPPLPMRGGIWDSQWVNVVNDPSVLNATDKDQAVSAAIKLAEKYFRLNAQDYARQAIAPYQAEIERLKTSWSTMAKVAKETADTNDRLASERDEAIAQSKRVSTEWQPIETTPKDGAILLRLRSGALSIESGLHVRTTSAFDDKGESYYTHWMPLPAAPQAADAKRVPDGYVLAPLKMNQAMRDVVDHEGWDWADLLAAAQCVTEDEYAIAQANDDAAPQAPTGETK